MFVEQSLGRPLSPAEHAKLSAVVPLVKERTKVLPEVPGQVRFLFEPLDGYDEASWEKVMTTPEAPIALDGATTALGPLDEWSTDAIDEALRGMLAERELSGRKGFQPIRVAVSGSTVSPPLFESLEILGKDESLARIADARSKIT